MTSSSGGDPTSGVVRIGTRGSKLALWQAHTIRDQLIQLGENCDIKIIKTQGDKIDNVPFAQLEGKGFFTKELEEALLASEVDLAVHSLKDLTTDMPAGLALAALVGREDPRELLLAKPEAVDKTADTTLPLKKGIRIGTSAARRQAQIHALRPDLEITDLRGNVPTRITRLREGKYDAILLARAGVMRLELNVDDLFVKALPVDEFVPPPGQGMLAIQCRNEQAWLDSLGRLDCPDDGQGVRAERWLLEQLEGGCQLPFGVNIQPAPEGWRLEAFLASGPPDDQPWRLSTTGPNPADLAGQAWSAIQELRRKDQR